MHPETPSRRPGGLINAIAWMRDLALSVLIAVVLIVFLYQPVKVEGTSMMPVLDNQERIFINKFTYRLSSVERGDLVVFWHDSSKSFIKRVVGLPGDRVEIDRGTVLVNGRVLREDYIQPDYRDEQSWGPGVVPANKYFVLGDHRSSSSDSRAWGFVDEQAIYGKAVFVYWPLDKIGRLR
jgi:signal peptidase I